MTIKIEKNVTMPPKSNRGGGRKAKYPFDSMEVGASFFLAPEKDEDVKKLSARMSSTISNRNSKEQGKFGLRTTLQNPDEPETKENPTGVRVWRLE